MKDEEVKHAGELGLVKIRSDDDKGDNLAETEAKLRENNDEPFKFKDLSQIKTIDHLF